MSKIVERLELHVVGSKKNGSERAIVRYNCTDSVNTDLRGPPKQIDMSMADFLATVASVLTPQQAVGLWYAMMNAAEAKEGITLSQPPNTPDWPTGAQLAVSAVTDSGCHLEWPAALTATSIAGYKVFQNAVEIASLAGDVLSYDVTGLSAETSYLFKVEAAEGTNWTTDGPSAQVLTQQAPA